MILLASASPRRRELLLAAGLSFEVVPSGVDESYAPELSGEEVALELAARKALDVARRQIEGDGRPGEAWVVGSDTVVVLGEGSGAERLLGKPRGAAEAGEMLAALSGSRHRVITGVCVVHLPGLAERRAAETTWVTMRSITDAEREAYVASGEWRDKAGGYAIQETADRFVTGLEGGGFDNVVGLPVSLCRRLLADAGAPV